MSEHKTGITAFDKEAYWKNRNVDTATKKSMRIIRKNQHTRLSSAGPPPLITKKAMLKNSRRWRQLQQSNDNEQLIEVDNEPSPAPPENQKPAIH